METNQNTGIGNRNHLRLLKLLDAESQERLLREASRRPTQPGEVICREGEEGSELFVLVEGQVRVTVEGLEGVREVARLEGGDYFGEMAPLTNQRRNATVVAEGSGELLCVGRELLMELLGRNARLREALGRVALRRAEDLVERMAA